MAGRLRTRPVGDPADPPRLRRRGRRRRGGRDRRPPHVRAMASAPGRGPGGRHGAAGSGARPAPAGARRGRGRRGAESRSSARGFGRRAAPDVRAGDPPHPPARSPWSGRTGPDRAFPDRHRGGARPPAERARQGARPARRGRGPRGQPASRRATVASVESVRIDPARGSARARPPTAELTAARRAPKPRGPCDLDGTLTGLVPVGSVERLLAVTTALDRSRTVLPTLAGRRSSAARTRGRSGPTPSWFGSRRRTSGDRS